MLNFANTPEPSLFPIRHGFPGSHCAVGIGSALPFSVAVTHTCLPRLGFILTSPFLYLMMPSKCLNLQVFLFLPFLFLTLYLLK